MRYRVLASVALALAVLAAAAVWTVAWLLPERGRPDGFSDLVWAAREGRPESVRLLVEAGSDPDQRDDGVNHWTPLLHAVHKNQLESVRALLAAGAEVDRPAPNGLTPLMLAAAQGEAEIVEALLAAGADPRATQPGGQTVLTLAVASGDPRIVRAVLERAPDLRLKHTLRDWAARAKAYVGGGREVIAMAEGKGGER